MFSTATALSAAAHRGHPAPITLLILNHADVNKCGAAGWSPLHAAAYGGNSEAVRLLMAKGADEYAAEIHGATAIDIAVRCENVDCILLMGGTVPDELASSTGGEEGHGGDHTSGGEDLDQPPGLESSRHGTRKAKSSRKANRTSRANDITTSKLSVKTTEVTNPIARRMSSFREVARRSSMRRDSPREREGRKEEMVRAIYKFDAESSSEIDLIVGEKYYILKKESSDGWTFGQNRNGDKGLFPTQYVEKC